MAQQSKILIADDDQANVELLKAYLESEKYDIDVAVNCEETLERALSFHPDVILLAGATPQFVGYEVCQKLKENHATRKIMVLMITALNDLLDIERAVRAGTDDFLSQPINKIELCGRVENLIKIRHVT